MAAQLGNGVVIPLPYLVLGVLALCAGTYGVGHWRGAAEVREEHELAAARAEASTAKAETKQAEQTVKVVTEYVDRIQTVEKHIPVVRDRVIRVCDEATGRAGVPGGSRNPDATARANTPDRDDNSGSAQLAKDLIACRSNTEKLRALQAWKRDHGG